MFKGARTLGLHMTHVYLFLTFLTHFFQIASSEEMTSAGDIALTRLQPGPFAELGKNEG